MSILESIRSKLQIIGMTSNQSIQKYPFNARNLASLLVHVINIVSTIGYLISGTNDLMEFTESLFLTITAIVVASIFINLLWRMRRLFEFIDHLEETVDQSK